MYHQLSTMVHKLSESKRIQLLNQGTLKATICPLNQFNSEWSTAFLVYSILANLRFVNLLKSLNSIVLVVASASLSVEVLA